MRVSLGSRQSHKMYYIYKMSKKIMLLLLNAQIIVIECIHAIIGRTTAALNDDDSTIDCRLRRTRFY